MSDKKKIEEMSFEEAMSELQTIVRNIETGKDNLEDIIRNYERGNALKEFCDKKLKEAKLRIDKIVKKQGGTLSLEPLDGE
ncbi:MAG: exodeoxyribonuclease VII small subunit [Rickettsiales bacterium]|nr:exodeoxyribonuclease VII small subunit [Rickettsiales bacterium]